MFITVDPAGDTPERLARYLANFGSRIIGLTGNSEQIAAVAKAYRVYYAPAEHEQSGIDLVSHPTFLYLMNPGGKLHAVFRPDASADQLAAALRAAFHHKKQTARRAEEGCAMMGTIGGMMGAWASFRSSLVLFLCWEPQSS